jgi:molybdopterin-guanine dinucleotide biosynthesis protein A
MMGAVKKKIRCGGRPMTAVVLAGGRGRRMKADKARLDVGGRTLLEHVLDQVEPYFDEVLISVAPGQKLPPFRAVRFSAQPDKSIPAAGPAARIRFVSDERPGLGPIGGLHAALKAASNDACAVIACDIPEIDIALLRTLARAAENADIAVPVGPSELPEPLFAVYRRSILPAIGALLGQGERSLLPLYTACRTATVRFDDPGRILNLNSRRDYEAYLGSKSKRKPVPSGSVGRGSRRRGREARRG